MFPEKGFTILKLSDSLAPSGFPSQFFRLETQFKYFRKNIITFILSPANFTCCQVSSDYQKNQSRGYHISVYFLKCRIIALCFSREVIFSCFQYFQICLPIFFFPWMGDVCMCVSLSYHLSGDIQGFSELVPRPVDFLAGGLEQTAFTNPF